MKQEMNASGSFTPSDLFPSEDNYEIKISGTTYVVNTHFGVVKKSLVFQCKDLGKNHQFRHAAYYAAVTSDD